MTWEEFAKKYHVRCADKCCANCAYGSIECEGECDCEHPYLINKDGGLLMSGGMVNTVCDLWKVGPLYAEDYGEKDKQSADSEIETLKAKLSKLEKGNKSLRKLIQAHPFFVR